MKFAIRFFIGNRLGRASIYSLVEFCLYCIDRYGLREHEVCTIVTLRPGEKHTIKKVLEVTRVK